jgi:uncharacterized membrane protein
MKFLRGSALAAGVLFLASLGQVRGKGSISSQRWAQSNLGATEAQPVVRAESGPQAHSSSFVTDANITFTTITVPGAGYTGVWAINKTGEMVGSYGMNINGGNDAHGFLYRNGTFTYFDYPGQSVTVPSGINDSGLIVGYAGRGLVRGFLYNETTFTTLRDGSDSATFAMGINNAGVVVGGAGSIYATRGFELRGKMYQDVSPPGTYIYIYGSGINNLGEAVGWTDNGGFSYADGKFRNVDFPGASVTEVHGIADSGIVVGWYDTGAPPYIVYGFVRSNGKYISFGYPGALTFAYGINAGGQIVGAYTFDSQTYYGFITNPVAPADFQ